MYGHVAKSPKDNPGQGSSPAISNDLFWAAAVRLVLPSVKVRTKQLWYKVTEEKEEGRQKALTASSKKCTQQGRASPSLKTSDPVIST